MPLSGDTAALAPPIRREIGRPTRSRALAAAAREARAESLAASR